MGFGTSRAFSMETKMPSRRRIIEHSKQLNNFADVTIDPIYWVQ